METKSTGSIPAVELAHVTKEFADFERGGRPDPLDRRRSLLCTTRAERLWKDNDSADDRRDSRIRRRGPFDCTARTSPASSRTSGRSIPSSRVTRCFPT